MSLWFAIPLLVVVPGLWALLRRLLRPAPRLVLGERGILETGSGWGWIPWDEVEGAYPPTADEADTVRVRVRVTERLARILRRGRRPDGGAPLGGAVELRVDLSATELNAVELLHEILARTRGIEQP